MQFSKITSTRKQDGVLKLAIKVGLFLIIIILIVSMLSRIDFPSPNKEIEKIIPNEKIKIVK